MANPEHLEKLKQGVTTWNTWLAEGRKNELLYYIDLSKIDLSRADLTGTCLTKACLTKANLTKANLTKANLTKAKLSEANLKGADLKGADLKCAKLTRADLIEANLSEANLKGADLTGAILALAALKGANLRVAALKGAILRGADLTGANLTKAGLTKADLTGANLTGTDLTGANLTWADLTGADLTEADLTGANLTGADLTRTILVETKMVKTIVSHTSFCDVDLSQINGLDSIIHHSPSTIGIDTIFQSQGKISDIFLRRAGVPEQLIAYIPSFVGKPWEYYSCFISYSSKDQDLADRLYADLQKNNVRCWLATEDIKIGDKFRNKIDEAIKIHDKLLLILSETSISSEWVDDEVESAFEKERKRKSKGNEEPVLFPIRIDDSVMETDQAWATKIRRSRHIGDFTNWKDHDQYQKAFKRLLRDLQESRKPSSE